MTKLVLCNPNTTLRDLQRHKTVQQVTQPWQSFTKALAVQPSTHTFGKLALWLYKIPDAAK